MKYFHKVQITKHREAYLTELSFDDYKNLQKICVEDDLDLLHTYLRKLIDELSVEPIEELNLIDLFAIVVTMRSYSISNEKVIHSYDNGIKYKVTLDLLSMVDKVLKTYTSLQSSLYLDIDDFMIRQINFDALDPKNCIKSFILSNGDSVKYVEDIYDNLPISIKDKIDDKVSHISDTYSNLELFRITDEDNHTYVVNFDLSVDNVLSVLKILIKEDLFSIYKNIYSMKTKLNISLDEHKSMTVNEYVMYIKMFNDEQEELASESKTTEGIKLPSKNNEGLNIPS